MDIAVGLSDSSLEAETDRERCETGERGFDWYFGFFFTPYG